MDLLAILNFILFIVAVVLGAKWVLIKKLLKDISDAVSDDNISKKEASEILNDIKNLLGK